MDLEHWDPMGTPKTLPFLILTLSNQSSFWHFPISAVSDTFQFWHFPIWAVSDTFQFWHFPIWAVSDTFQFWHFPNLMNSDTFQFLVILTLSNSDTFRFWHFPTLTLSDSDTFQFGIKMDSDTFQFWHFPVSQKNINISPFFPAVLNRSRVKSALSNWDYLVYWNLGKNTQSLPFCQILWLDRPELSNTVATSQANSVIKERL